MHKFLFMLTILRILSKLRKILPGRTTVRPWHLETLNPMCTNYTVCTICTIFTIMIQIPVYKGNIILYQAHAGYNLMSIRWSHNMGKLENMARYAGQLLAPAEGFDLWLRFFFALWAVVPLVIFSSNTYIYFLNPTFFF